jgi:hypothetical protein
MRAVILPRFPSARLSYLILALAVGAILVSALLALALAAGGSPLDPAPDGTFFGPFRWVPGAQSTTA